MINLFATPRNIFSISFRAGKANLENYEEIIFERRDLISILELFYQA